MSQKLTEQSEPLNVMYYGDGGTGKTTALATMANIGPVLIVNAENGVKSKPLKKQGVNIENIEIFPGEGEMITFKSLENEWLRVHEALIKDPNAYVGVIWDSVTEIHKILLDQVVSVAFANAARTGKNRDEFFIDRADYGTMTEQIRRLVRKYRDLPCHFGMSALSRREQDDDGRVAYQPAVTPALQNDLIGWMDIVCVTSLVESGDVEEYRGLVKPKGKYRGKDRLNMLPTWLVTPTFERLVDYYDEKLELATDPIMQEAKKRAQAQKKTTTKEGTN